jgi:hypothetical protein
MKKILILLVIVAAPAVLAAQSCAPQSCDKTSCGPEGTKKKEAAVITSMRNELQSVIVKMSKSTYPFDKSVAEMKIEQGSNDDESLLFLSQAASTIRYEFVSKLSSNLIASLKEFKPSGVTSKQQMVSALKKEINILASQAENLISE